MGGVTKAVSGAVGAITGGGIGSALGTSIMGPFGGAVGGFLGAKGGISSLMGKGGGRSAPGIGGQVSPMQALQETGGAPLLASIAMGADPNQAIMSFFGASGDYNSWLATLDPASQSAVKGLSTQMNSIQQNTQLKTQAVQKLVNDFPDFMASAIPKYAGIADKMTMGAAQQALQNVAAKYAAGGQLSSGATAAAMARTAAEGERQNLAFGADLAGADWMNRFNQSNALLNFQQKMLGQGATAGESAIRQMWDVNAGQARSQFDFTSKQALEQQKMGGALGGAFGKVGGGLLGTALGTYFGGPAGGTAGGAAGSDIGGALGTFFGGQ